MLTDYTLVVRRYAPFESFGGGFEGDNRQFSTSMTAKARTVGVVVFSRDRVIEFRERLQQRLVLCRTLGRPQKSPPRRYRYARRSSQSACHWSVQRTWQGPFTVETSGNLPMKDVMLYGPIAGAIDRVNAWVRPKSPSPQGSPNIDTFLDVAVTVAGGYMTVEGVLRGDSFPNAEVFLLDSATRQNVAPLLDYQTNGGVAGPLRLVLSHPQTCRAEFRKRIRLQSDGSFGPGSDGPPIVFKER